MGKPIKIAILANGTQAKGEMRDVGGVAGKMGKAIGGAAVLGGAALVKMGVDAVSAGSDAEQSIGATQTVYGKYADTVIEKSNEARDALGLSANEYRELSNVTGALLSGAGVPMKGLAKLTDDLNTRAADLAATFGGSTKEAVEAVSSLMKGEADPIERYGISIKQSDVNARMAAKGLDKLEGAGKKQAEMQTRVELLMSKSAKTAGAFARESDTLANKQQRANAKFTDAEAKLGGILIPLVATATDLFADKFVPALETATDWLSENQDEIVATGKAIGGDLLPPLKTAAEVVGDVVTFFVQLPGPVKEVAVQAGLAALVLPRLTGALTTAGGAFTTASASARQFHAEMTYAETRGAALRGGIGKLGGMAKEVAGIGGMMALTSGLTDAATEGSSFASVMKGAAGGAGIGAMFGPVGALVGGAAGGGLTALMGAFSGAEDSAKNTRIELMRTKGMDAARAGANELKESLLGVVDAYGAAPRAAVKAGFYKDGKLSKDIQALRDQGLSMDTIVSAVMKDQEAWTKVSRDLLGTQYELNVQRRDLQTRYDAAAGQSARGVKGAEAERAALGEQLATVTTRYEDATVAVETFSGRVGQIDGVLVAHGTTVKELRGDLKMTAAEYNALPKKVRTQVEADGLPQTSRDAVRLIGQFKGLQGFKRIRAVVTASGADFTGKQIAGLQRRYKLTPQQVSTLVRLVGDKEAKAKAKGVNDAAKAAGKTKSEVKVTANTTGGERSIKSFKRTAQSVKDTKIIGPNFAAPTLVSVQAAKGVATSGGSGIGLNLSLGIAAGVHSGQGDVSGAVRSVVAQGIQAGRDEAVIKSPSRKTTKDGRFIALGLKAGIDGGKKGVTRAMRALVGSVLKESTSGAKGITGSIVTLLDKLDNGATSTKAKARLKRQRQEILKATAADTKKLAANGAEREALRTGNYLTYVKKGSDLYTKMAALNVKNIGDAKAATEAARQTFADFRTAVSDSVVQSGSLMKLGEGNGFGSVDQMIAHREALKAQAQEWQKVIAQLSDNVGTKLNDADLEALITAGPEASLGTAKALLAGGDTAIKKMNGLSGDLAKIGATMGQSTAKTLKQAGIDSSQGLVDGLLKNEKKLEKAAKQLAKKLVKAFEKEMGINSPSKRMAKATGFVIDGGIKGLNPARMIAQGRLLAKSLVNGYGDPSLNRATATVTGGTAAGTTVNITVNVPPTANAAEVGKEIQKHLDAYYRAGGRKAA